MFCKMSIYLHANVRLRAYIDKENSSPTKPGTETPHHPARSTLREPTGRLPQASEKLEDKFPDFYNCLYLNTLLHKQGAKGMFVPLSLFRTTNTFCRKRKTKNLANPKETPRSQRS